MSGLVGSAPAFYGNALGSNPEISYNTKCGRHKQRSGQHTLAQQKLGTIPYKKWFRIRSQLGLGLRRAKMAHKGPDP